jgi:cytochrome c biogenesis protein CcdA
VIQAPAGISPAFLWLAATAGALSLLTPCVFPMVPITVSYFLRHAQSSRTRAFTAVAIFGLGIIVTFTALGVTVAAVVGAAGLTRFAANAWVNLAIAAIFLALALNLLGFYQLNVSSRVLSGIDSATRGKDESDAVSTLLMGVLFTLTSFTCTAPFIGTLLVAASQGEWQRPIAGMLVYAIVFALPFIVLATVPRWINSLPSSGAWLNRIKVVMGFVELAAVAKFISNADLVWHWNIFTHDVVLAIWVALTLVTTFYLLGAFRLPHEPPLEPPLARAHERLQASGAAERALPHISASQAVPAVVFLALGMWLATGLTGGNPWHTRILPSARRRCACGSQCRGCARRASLEVERSSGGSRCRAPAAQACVHRFYRLHLHQLPLDGIEHVHTARSEGRDEPVRSRASLY